MNLVLHKKIKNYILISLIILFSLNSCGPKEDIEITVSKGTIPTYSWAGRPVNSLSIERYHDHKTVWVIITPSKDGIYSPVTHDIFLEGAIVFEDSLIWSSIDTADFSQPLIVGQKYTVQAWRTGIYSIGIKEFICTE